MIFVSGNKMKYRYTVLNYFAYKVDEMFIRYIQY